MAINLTLTLDGLPLTGWIKQVNCLFGVMDCFLNMEMDGNVYIFNKSSCIFWKMRGRSHMSSLSI